MRWIMCTLAAVGLAPAAAQAPSAATTAPQAPAVAPAQKLRCKSYTEIGSLARITRVCHTAAEWDRVQREGRSQAETYQQQPGPHPNYN